LRAHVLELVLELDLLGDGDAVLGDPGSAEALVDHDIATLGAESHLHRVGEDVDAAHDALTRIAAEFHVLGCHLATLSGLLSSLKSLDEAPFCASSKVSRRSRGCRFPS